MENVKELSLKDLENAAKEAFGDNLYPKYIGNGLYQVAPGVIGNEKLMKEVNKAIVEESKNLNNADRDNK